MQYPLQNPTLYAIEAFACCNTLHFSEVSLMTIRRFSTWRQLLTPPAEASFPLRSRATLLPQSSIKQFCENYSELHSNDDKMQALHALATALPLNHQRAHQFALHLSKFDPKSSDSMQIREFEASASALRDALIPQYEILLENIASMPGGMKFVLNLRADLLNCIQLMKSHRKSPEPLSVLVQLEKDMLRLLQHWFASSFLSLQRIDKSSDPNVLKTVQEKETVQPFVRDAIFDRLENHRRCFGFFHPSMPTEPVIFVNVCLAPRIPENIDDIIIPLNKRSENVSSEPDANAAIFYSINSTQGGLRGVELGHVLIKRVTIRLQREFPHLKEFCTYSPIPGFRSWLTTLWTLFQKGAHNPIVSDDLMAATNLSKERFNEDFDLFIHQAEIDMESLNLFKPVLISLVNRYVFEEKRRNFALDPVTQ
jgi:malonyl-CoA decarboxylase